MRVLVVEDEESFIDALSVGLEREGFDVAVARDGAGGRSPCSTGAASTSCCST